MRFVNFLVLMTGVSADTGYSSEFTEQRANQIQSKDFFGIQQFFNLGYKPASLEMLDKADVIEKLANIIKNCNLLIFVPYPETHTQIIILLNVRRLLPSRSDTI